MTVRFQTGSSINATAVWTTRSLTVGMPQWPGLTSPFGNAHSAAPDLPDTSWFAIPQQLVPHSCHDSSLRYRPNIPARPLPAAPRGSRTCAHRCFPARHGAAAVLRRGCKTVSPVRLALRVERAFLQLLELLGGVVIRFERAFPLRPAIIQSPRWVVARIRPSARLRSPAGYTGRQVITTTRELLFHRPRPPRVGSPSKQSRSCNARSIRQSQGCTGIPVLQPLQENCCGVTCWKQR